MISKETMVALNAALMPRGEYLCSSQRQDEETFTLCRLVPTRQNVDVEALARQLCVELGTASRN